MVVSLRGLFLAALVALKDASDSCVRRPCQVVTALMGATLEAVAFHWVTLGCREARALKPAAGSCADCAVSALARCRRLLKAGGGRRSRNGTLPGA